jgi:nucleotide-binding universal stress UspA family protein
MPLTGDSTVLVPVDVSDVDPPESGILDHLRPVDVVVLGYYTVPKQTAPAHLKEAHEAEAAARLAEIVARFDDSDHEVESVLVFTKDRQDSIDRVAEQHDCDAVLITGATRPIERILVPLRGKVNVDRIVSLVADLERTSGASITVFHSAAADADPDRGESVLRGVADRLADEGIDRDRLRRELSERGDPRAAIADLADEHDLVILGETDPSLRDRIVGTTLGSILDSIDVPAIVVRDTA